MTEDALEDRLIALVRKDGALMQVLETLRALDLPDWCVFSGAVYQCVWNGVSGRAPGYGIRDYDVGYFDAYDIGWDAEDHVIKRVANAFDEPLKSAVEVRNQARVHLWFEQRFGEPYSPLSSTSEALTRFVAPAFAVGVRLGEGEHIHVTAPFGLEDVFAMRLAPNPSRPRARGWQKAVDSARARWPEVIVEDV